MRNILFFALVCGHFWVAAQKRCGTVQDAIAPENLAFETWLAEQMAAKRAAKDQMEEVLTLPVVFHIIHNGEPEGSGGNISEDRITDQLRIINEDFGRRNADTTATPPEFENVAASTGIQFVLAKQDPEGLPTTGITRTQGSLPSYRLSNDAQLKSEIHWPAEHYVNIYVAELQGFLGWASFPFSNLEGIDQIEANSLTDGVVIDFQYIGTNPNTGGTFESFGRTLTHELGHYFGLKHVWGDGGCTVDDFCQDTPTSNQNYQDQCPSEDESSCDSNDMYSNFLNYTDDFCMNIFTVCQAERMQTVLSASPRRISLPDSPALLEPITVSNDIGIRRIITPQEGSCQSTFSPRVEVRNYGTNIVTDYVVQLLIDKELIETINVNTSMGLLNIQNLQFASVELDPSLPHDFQFGVVSVNGGSDNNPLNDSAEVTLAPTLFQNTPFLEDFETEGSQFFRATSADGHLWAITTAPAELGNNQAAIAQFYQETSGFGEQHIYLLPNIDLSNVNSALLTFRYAYGHATGATEKDGLVLALSRDCGATFSTDDFLYELFGSDLRTTSRSVTGAFVPVDESEWNQVGLNITSLLGISDLRFAIITFNGSGNNIYLDDVDLSPTALNALDLGITGVDNLPVVTCSENIDPRVTVRNFGFEQISSYDLGYVIGSQSDEENITTSLISGEEESQRLDINALTPGAYDVLLVVSSPNGGDDENEDDNVLSRNIVIDAKSQNLPIREGFSGTHDWITTNPTGPHIWELTSGESNVSYQASGFQSGADGEDHWLVSPLLNTGNLQNGSLVFRMAYSENGTSADRLRVLLSLSCGDRFEQTLVDLTGSELSTALGGGNFQPSDDDDWREMIVDISEFVDFPEIRIAFVYTNSSGSNLFIDDVEIFPTSSDHLKRFESQLWVYPNPSPDGFFNVTLNLPRKDDVTLRLVDLSGRTILFIRDSEALNQTYNMEGPGLNGVYLLKVEGQNTNLVQRIAIGR